LRRWLWLAALGALAALLLSGCGGSAEAVDVAPSLLPRNKQLVEASGRILYVAGGRIWEWADGATHALTGPGVRWEGASWSPDGRSMAASEVGENHSDVFVLDASGNRLRQLTRHWSHVSVQQSAWGRKPAWSPDGTQIAYVSDLGQSDMSLWTVGARGGDNRRQWNMPPGSGGLDWPSWSPEKRRIAFTSYPPTGGVHDKPQVFVLNLETWVLIQLTELKDGAFDPAWSPDGSTIAFAGRWDGRTRIMTVRADGKGAARLTDGTHDRAPAWSPEGDELAYLSLGGGGFDLWAVRVANGGVSEPRQLTSGQDADAVSGVSWAR
jgi:TolB protein